ncbi:hypothetical protein RBSH_04280 [Rhodopirellula baltica SH28]|uniref:Uncharacterized protein n=1 Tax=Rhodopirellula baltica SH28 TaxID=993517 RepID=K5DC56_RHOBT|nr:hypothetical protein RBSH_04280 [Rhodopirellula baltica SH28]
MHCTGAAVARASKWTIKSRRPVNADVPRIKNDGRSYPHEDRRAPTDTDR